MNNIQTRNYPGLGTVDFVSSRRARRLNITIKDSRSVRVAVPHGVSLKTAVRFFEEHRDWVRKALDKFSNAERNRRVVFDQDFSTREHQLVLQPHGKNHCAYHIGAETLHFFFPSNRSVTDQDIQAQILTAIIETFRLEAKNYLPHRVDLLARKFGLRYNKLFIKNLKSRWGSCSVRNNINLNLQLMRFDDRVIDYIIIHELLHTRIKNHSREFQAALVKLFPETPDVRRFLKNEKPFVPPTHLK